MRARSSTSGVSLSLSLVLLSLSSAHHAGIVRDGYVSVVNFYQHSTRDREKMASYSRGPNGPSASSSERDGSATAADRLEEDADDLEQYKVVKGIILQELSGMMQRSLVVNMAVTTFLERGLVCKETRRWILYSYAAAMSTDVRPPGIIQASGTISSSSSDG